MPAVLGSLAILAAVFLTQFASGSSNSAAPQLAVARTDDATASRGAERSDDVSGLANQIATAAQDGTFGSPADAPDATTTTVAPTTTTTAAPTTTTTAKPAPKPTTPPTTAKPKSTPAPTTPAEPPVVDPGATSICALSPGNWCSLAKCESGDRNANTGNGFYGYFQFNNSTWKANGGTSASAYGASASEQLRVAQNLQKSRGWQPWPQCGARLS